MEKQLLIDNTHLTVEDFAKIFNPMSAQYMYKKWIACKGLNFIFETYLATNEVLAWERAKAGQVKDIVVINTLNLN